MKGLLLGVTILVGGALLGGCPIYSNDRYCNSSGCYDCPSNTVPSNGTCVQWTCSTSADCDPGYVCDTTSYSCVSGPTGGYDAGTTASGCGPCAYGSICKLSGGVPQCVASGGGAVDASSDVARPDAKSTTDAAPTPDAAVAHDASPATTDAGDASFASDAASDAPVVPPAPASCNADTDCGDGGNGAKCVDGKCAPESALCSDTTQCLISGEACVNGLCVPHCGSSAPCPAGYACDFTLGVCDLNPTPCTGSGRSGCIGGSTCVEGRCVSPCAAADSGPACPTGQICVNDGCIPDEGAHASSCKNDGQSGLLANECTAADTCLHHSCYVSCDPDDGGTCAEQGTFCKQVTVSAGTYAVCATATNLGNDCDPAIGQLCSAGVCLDGYCK